MLKKIPVQQLRQGMFVDKICGSWIDHPFWKKSFLIESSADYQTLKASSIAEFIIDTKKGLDVFPDADNQINSKKSEISINETTVPVKPLRESPVSRMRNWITPQAFVRSIGIYPAGSLVMLKSEPNGCRC